MIEFLHAQHVNRIGCMGVLDAVIVGAGAAGIAAARWLTAAGRRVMVLEARDRIGGRTAVDHSLGVPVDMGAAFLHFADQNPWTVLAEQQGFTVIRREPGWGAAAGVGAHLPSEAEKAAVAEGYERYHGIVAAAAAN